MELIKFDGQPISAPGLYASVPISTYHSGKLCVGPSISSSGLRTIFSKSESHFYDGWRLNPGYDPKSGEESEPLILGRATHHLLLGEPKFAAEFAVRPDEYPDGCGKPWSGNSKVCKEWLAERAEEGRTVLLSSQIERVRGMALALSKRPLVQQGILNGLIETTMVSQDRETGVYLLARPDVVPTDSGDFVDLKTTTSVAYDDLVKTYGSYAYFQQGALVQEVYEAVTGEKMASFSLLFIESKRPFCVSRPRRLKAEDLELGRRANRNALRRFVRALNTGLWPGPDGEDDSEAFIELSLRQREVAESRMART